MEILTKSLLNISESIGIPRNPLLAINPNISNLTYNPLPINSYPSFPPAPQNKVVRWATLFCGAGGSRVPFFILLRKSAPLHSAWRPSGSAVSLQAFARTNTLEPALGGMENRPFVPLLCPKYIVYLWL